MLHAWDALKVIKQIPEGFEQLQNRHGDVMIYTPENIAGGYGHEDESGDDDNAAGDSSSRLLSQTSDRIFYTVEWLQLSQQPHGNRPLIKIFFA